jgi:3-hydroxy-9,10-secoandrosta-1,3,5(10)-triene-9,17-dione monooxygenase
MAKMAMPESGSRTAVEPPAAVSSDYATMLERTRALVPILRERAGEAEGMRRMPADTERNLHEAGLFRILQPKRVGGSELDYVALVDFAAELARGDASVAWNMANLSSHHWMLGMFPEATQDALWDDDRNVLIASSFVFPAGRAKRVDGGYRLSGRWPFSSGVDPSTWNMLGGLVAPNQPGAPPEYRIFLAHRQNYRIIDVWNTMGLRGTGSNDVALEDVFIPEAMTLAVADVGGGPTPGSARNPSPLYRLPVFALFPFVLSGVALGNAQACLDDYVEAIRKRASRYSLAKIAEFQTTQIKVAEASAKLDAARRIMRSICIEAMADAANGRIPDMLEKTRYRRDGAYSVNLCTEAVQLLFAASGAGGLYLAAPLERQFRDAHAINAHIAFSFDAAGSNYGRVALGFASENLTL